MNAIALVLVMTSLLAGDLPLARESGDSRYLVLKEFVSPVSGEVFYASVLRSEPAATSWDYDRCPHPPVNALAYSLVIDPGSGYVADSGEFNEPTHWSAADLADILGEPRFSRLSPEGMPWAGAYPWEKFENAALLSAAGGEPGYYTGNWWLMAAWSVRLDVISGHNEFDTDVEDLFARLPRRGPDAGDLLTIYELQLARYWQQMRDTGQLLDISNADLGLALAWLYRSRGELVDAEYWLRSAALDAPGLPEESPLYQYLLSSIELERSYLRSARLWLQQSWNNNEIPPSMESGTAFILGEINRRLGDTTVAVNWYDLASENAHGVLNTAMVQHLRELASGNRGY